jgi:NAD(P)-dependent dehydrogenase (short-subunit alcohol dehydrogenase family)
VQATTTFNLSGKVALVTGGASGTGIAAVLYFASRAARSVTNQVLAVDGGFSVT